MQNTVPGDAENKVWCEFLSWGSFPRGIRLFFPWSPVLRVYQNHMEKAET